MMAPKPMANSAQNDEMRNSDRRCSLPDRIEANAATTRMPANHSQLSSETQLKAASATPPVRLAHSMSPVK